MSTVTQILLETNIFFSSSFLCQPQITPEDDYNKKYKGI